MFVWCTDVIEEIRERKALAMSQKVFKSIDASADMTSSITMTAAAAVAESSEHFIDIFESNSLSDGMRVVNETIASYPWKGAVREPSHWVEGPDSRVTTAAPTCSLELNYVYGYRGWDCRNNISFADSAYEVVYHVSKGAGCVVAVVVAVVCYVCVTVCVNVGV